MANSKRKFKLLCAKLSSGLKYMKIWTALHLFFFFMFFFFCSSFGSRSEWPHALQCLIEMLIRWCPFIPELPLQDRFGIRVSVSITRTRTRTRTRTHTHARTHARTHTHTHLDVSHWSIIISISGNDHVGAFHNTLECLVQILLFQLKLKQGTVHLVHEQHRLDTFSNGLTQYSLSLYTDTWRTNVQNC